MGKQSRLSPQEARDAIEKHGGLRAAARALGMDNGFLSRISKRPDKPDPRAGREAFVDEAASRPDTVTGGIYLTPATRICDRRPPVTVRAKFYSLQKGKAFKLSDLSRQWGFSVETITRHARDEGCFAYVDTTGHDDFEECAMHPETAAARLKGN